MSVWDALGVQLSRYPRSRRSSTLSYLRHCRIHYASSAAKSRQVMQDRGWLAVGCVRRKPREACPLEADLIFDLQRTHVGSIEVFDLWEGKHLQTLICDEEAILCLTAHDNYIAAGSQDACAYVWRLHEDGKTFHLVHELADHDGRVSSTTPLLA